MFTIEIKDFIVPVIWAIVAVIMFIIEASTVQLVSVWFGISALVTCVLAAFKVPLYVQFIVFTSLSVVLFVVTALFFRQKRKKYFNAKTETPDELADEVAVVTKDIKPGEIGEVKTRYERFNALGKDINDEFLVGEKVKVLEVSGNKLIVGKLEK